jgi:hypothetical protein
MAKAKKTKKEEVKIEEQSEQLQPTIALSQKKYEDCEWCFQFDEDEPKVFAWTSEDMTDEEPTVTFTIGNTEGAYVSFSKDGKTFKLFARELTDTGKELREFQNKLANESTNKEA